MSFVWAVFHTARYRLALFLTIDIRIAGKNPFLRKFRHGRRPGDTLCDIHAGLSAQGANTATIPTAGTRAAAANIPPKRGGKGRAALQKLLARRRRGDRIGRRTAAADRLRYRTFLPAESERRAYRRRHVGNHLRPRKRKEPAKARKTSGICRPVPSRHQAHRTARGAGSSPARATKTSWRLQGTFRITARIYG